jgi:hypothetical protein
MGRSIIMEVEGFVPADTTVVDSGAIGRAVQRSILDAVPESRTALWSARSIPSG